MVRRVHISQVPAADHYDFFVGRGLATGLHPYQAKGRGWFDKVINVGKQVFAAGKKAVGEVAHDVVDTVKQSEDVLGKVAKGDIAGAVGQVGQIAADKALGKVAGYATDALGSVTDSADALGKIAKGDFKGAAEEVGSTLVNRGLKRAFGPAGEALAPIVSPMIVDAGMNRMSHLQGPAARQLRTVLGKDGVATAQQLVTEPGMMAMSQFAKQRLESQKKAASQTVGTMSSVPRQPEPQPAPKVPQVTKRSARTSMVSAAKRRRRAF